MDDTESNRKTQSSTSSELLTSSIRGLLSLLFRGGEGITRLSANVHLQFSHLPWLGDTDVKPTIDYAPFPYRIIAKLFEGCRKLTDASHVNRIDPLAVTDPQLKRFIAILNGILGDRMHQWGNPLSIPMRLLSREDIDFTPTDDSSFESDKHVIFLHGLCMHDSDWNDKEHHSFVNTLRQHGFEPYWLRYNSGRSISENGREFHELMTAFDRQLPDDHTVTLIGHSMGGLIVRSACYYAEQNKSNWLDRVTGTAYLGSPHFGAPLERIGYLANQLLGVLPFTKPFMRLGQLRGRGIRELRYGSVFPDDEDPKDNGPIRLTDSMRHLFIGTTINELGEKTPLGDGMVPLTSALGEEESTNRKVVAERLERIHLQNIGHVELVSAPEVYSTLEDWVLRDSTPSNEATKPMSEPSPETTTA